MALNLLEQLPPQPRLSTAAIHAQAEAEGTPYGYTATVDPTAWCWKSWSMLDFQLDTLLG